MEESIRLVNELQIQMNHLYAVIMILYALTALGLGMLIGYRIGFYKGKKNGR